ncbi:MAG: putative NBD/HSP70 family sugar kinase [Candidatus Marinamargulisbacteria bacterium]|jgi:predicted NBD/HSP70 family sugar kinase
MAKKPCLITIDIGGSKIAFGVLPIVENQVIPKLLFRSVAPSVRGKSALASTLKDIVARAHLKAHSYLYEPIQTLFIGLPGRLTGPNNTIIAPGSAAQLWAHENEFDNVDIRELLQGSLGKYTLILKNDGLTQMAGGLLQLTESAAIAQSIKGKRIAYIGPGTGLGGGFCTFNSRSNMSFFTDGHIYDILLPSGDTRIRAEDLISSVAFKSFASETPREINSSVALIAQYRPKILKMGNALGQLIESIHLGNIEKTPPENAWPQNDINKVKGTEIFMLGGSIATKGEIARLLQMQIKAHLSAAHLAPIRCLPIPDVDQAALIGAAPFVTI